MSAEAGTRIASIGAPAACTNLETWLATGETLFETLSDRSWQVADWLSAGIDAWGMVATAHAEKISGFSRGKISNYNTVSTEFAEFRRRNTLSFSHHLEVARLPEAEQGRLLDAAESGEWTRNQLREAVREATGEIEADRLRVRVAELEHELAAERMDGQAALKASKNMERTVAAVAKRIVAGLWRDRRFAGRMAGGTRLAWIARQCAAGNAEAPGIDAAPHRCRRGGRVGQRGRFLAEACQGTRRRPRRKGGTCRDSTRFGAERSASCPGPRLSAPAVERLPPWT